MILIIKHISIEGPGLIGEYFENKGYFLKTIELGFGEELPQELDGIEAVIVLGGPMNVYEEDTYPFLTDEDSFIKSVLAKKIPYIGLCLGAQLLAKSCGAKITKNPSKEIGFYQVSFTEHAKDDRLFKGLPDCLDAFQWHEDTFDIPSDGVHLASSPLCKNQVFRFGDNAWGIQFHLEVDGDAVHEWSREYFDKNDPVTLKKGEEMRDKYLEFEKDLKSNVDKLCSNFEEVIAVRRDQRP